MNLIDIKNNIKAKIENSLTQKTLNELQNVNNKKISEKKLKKVCQDFESLFINYMLKEMKKTVPEDPIFGESMAKKIYDSMYFEKISIELSKRGGIGLADLLYENLKEEIFSK